MKLYKLLQLVDDFSNLSSTKHKFKCCEPRTWCFEASKQKIPYAKTNGIYMYFSKFLTIEEAKNEEVLYIGKSNGNIAARVWSHVGKLYENDQKTLCVPRFKYHQWANDKSVSTDIRNLVANGEICVVTIQINTDTKSFLPLALEKYLLALCVVKDGKLPVLNKDI